MHVRWPVQSVCTQPYGPLAEPPVEQLLLDC